MHRSRHPRGWLQRRRRPPVRRLLLGPHLGDVALCGDDQGGGEAAALLCRHLAQLGEDALRELFRCAGTQFDYECVEAFAAVQADLTELVA